MILEVYTKRYNKRLVMVISLKMGEFDLFRRQWQLRYQRKNCSIA